MNDRGAIEYRVLRDTIRQRGTMRMALVPVIFIGWAVVAIATAAIIEVAISTLIPLLVLAAGFESVFALHINVERIGRYLQAFHEREGGWESVAMTFGTRFPSRTPDPLFSQLFVLAVSFNFLPVALGGAQWEIIFLAAMHALLVYRVRMARGVVRRQREEDLQRFQSIRDESLDPGSK